MCFLDEEKRMLTTAMERVLAEHPAGEEAKTGKGEDNVSR